MYCDTHVITAYWGATSTFKQIVSNLEKAFNFDWDFTGDNGKAYLCSMAEKKNSNSNMEYISEYLLEEYQGEDYRDNFIKGELVQRYIEFFFKVGGSYYLDFDYDFIHNEYDTIIGVAIAYVTN